MTANPPYDPPMNTDNDYYQTFFSDLFVCDSMLVVRYMSYMLAISLNFKHLSSLRVFQLLKSESTVFGLLLLY